VYKIPKYFFIRVKRNISSIDISGFYNQNLNFFGRHSTFYDITSYANVNFLFVYVYDIARFISLRTPTNSLIQPNIISLVSGYTLTATYNNISTELHSSGLKKKGSSYLTYTKDIAKVKQTDLYCIINIVCYC